MTDGEKVREWCRFYEASQIKINALKAVLENDGEIMLENVLKVLKLRTASDVVKIAECCRVLR